MNFDIKYTTYLQIFNFIKIKQVWGTILGAQSQGSKVKPQATLGALWGQQTNQLTGWDPPVRGRRKRKRKKRKARVYRTGVSFKLTGGTRLQRQWLTRTRLIQGN